MQEIIKSALKYFGFFLLIYGSLTAVSLIPAVGSLFNQIYRSATQPILQTTLSKAYIQLKKQEGNADIIRVSIVTNDFTIEDTIYKIVDDDFLDIYFK